MSIIDIEDIRGYYDEPRKPNDYRIPGKTLGELIEKYTEEWARPLERWEVRNSEPREPIGSQKRAIILERDGGRCRYCGDGDKWLVMDHIIPRSAFESKDLSIADRSDNLQSACWDCNARRSNFDHPFVKRMGVTACCWYCANPDYEARAEAGEDVTPRPEVMAFCGRCGISAVPSVAGWVL